MTQEAHLMAFLSIHTMEGDPDDLLARKREHMDPVVQRLAPGLGAIWSVTARTGTGIITVNLWDSPEGAARLAAEPQAQQAQLASGLPKPATFERYTDAEYTVYQHG
jgi:hypothetical protein